MLKGKMTYKPFPAAERVKKSKIKEAQVKAGKKIKDVRKVLAKDKFTKGLTDEEKEEFHGILDYLHELHEIATEIHSDEPYDADIIEEFDNIAEQAEELKEEIIATNKESLGDSLSQEEVAALRVKLLAHFYHKPASQYQNDKHLKPGNRQQQAIKTGNGQFLQGYNDEKIKDLEKEALNQGTIKHHSGNTYYFFQIFSYNIGYVGGTGKETKNIRAEWSSGAISHFRTSYRGANNGLEADKNSPKYW